MTNDSIPQDSPSENSDVEVYRFEYGVGSGSATGTIFVDAALELAVESVPTNSWVSAYNHDYESQMDSLEMYGIKNKRSHLFDLPYFESKAKRERLVNLIKKALDLA